MIGLFSQPSKEKAQKPVRRGFVSAHKQPECFIVEEYVMNLSFIIDVTTYKYAH